MRSTIEFADLLVLASAVTEYVLISAYLVDISMGISSCAAGLKICSVTAGIKKYKSIISKKKSIIE